MIAENPAWPILCSVVVTDTEPVSKHPQSEANLKSQDGTGS